MGCQCLPSRELGTPFQPFGYSQTTERLQPNDRTPIAESKPLKKQLLFGCRMVAGLQHHCSRINPNRATGSTLYLSAFHPHCSRDSRIFVTAHLLHQVCVPIMTRHSLTSSNGEASMSLLTGSHPLVLQTSYIICQVPVPLTFNVIYEVGETTGRIFPIFFDI